MHLAHNNDYSSHVSAWEVAKIYGYLCQSELIVSTNTGELMWIDRIYTGLGDCIIARNTNTRLSRIIRRHK